MKTIFNNIVSFAILLRFSCVILVLFFFERLNRNKVAFYLTVSMFKSCPCKSALINEYPEFIYVFSRHGVLYDSKMENLGFVKMSFL